MFDLCYISGDEDGNNFILPLTFTNCNFYSCGSGWFYLLNLLGEHLVIEDCVFYENRQKV